MEVQENIFTQRTNLDKLKFATKFYGQNWQKRCIHNDAPMNSQFPVRCALDTVTAQTGRMAQSSSHTHTDTSNSRAAGRSGCSGQRAEEFLRGIQQKNNPSPESEGWGSPLPGSPCGCCPCPRGHVPSQPCCSRETTLVELLHSCSGKCSLPLGRRTISCLASSRFSALKVKLRQRLRHLSTGDWTQAVISSMIHPILCYYHALWRQCAKNLRALPSMLSAPWALGVLLPACILQDHALHSSWEWASSVEYVLLRTVAAEWSVMLVTLPLVCAQTAAGTC